MKSILFFLVCLSIGSICSIGHAAHQSGSTTSFSDSEAQGNAEGSVPVVSLNETDNNLMQLMYLVRPPDFLGSCSEITKEEAVLIIPPLANADEIKLGDKFTVITSASAVVEVTFKGLVESCDALFNVDEVRFGILRLAKKIDWTASHDALLSIKKTRISPTMVGSIKQLSQERKKEFTALIKQYMSAEPRFEVVNVLQLRLPAFGKECFYIDVDHTDWKEYATLGDKASRTTGFYFSKKEDGWRLLMKGDVPVVRSITDLNMNGIAEVLVHGGGSYEGLYDVRLFDCDKFGRVGKILYRWMD